MGTPRSDGKVLLCPSCGKQYRARDYDPSRRYRCASCSAALISQSAVERLPREEAIPEEAYEAGKEPRNRLGRFVLVKELGRGGMGVVQKAWDEGLGRWVAIKFILPGAATEDDLARFKREARLAAQLDHPNIAAIHEIGEHGGRQYIVMKYIEGRTLQTLAGGDPRKSAAYVREACRAVGHAHRQGVIHRDLKPHNIMVDREGRVYVMDFGLARSLVTGTGALTGSLAVLGTPTFMAPEQARGRPKEIDARTDIYALGATLWALLAGRAPHVGETAQEVLVKAATESLPAIRTLRPDAPEGLEAILLRATAMAKENRYASADDLGDALAKFLKGAPPRPPTTKARAKPGSIRRRQVALGILGACALVVTGAVILVATKGTTPADTGGPPADASPAPLSVAETPPPTPTPEREPAPAPPPPPERQPEPPSPPAPEWNVTYDLAAAEEQPLAPPFPPKLPEEWGPAAVEYNAWVDVFSASPDGAEGRWEQLVRTADPRVATWALGALVVARIRQGDVEGARRNLERLRDAGAAPALTEALSRVVETAAAETARREWQELWARAQETIPAGEVPPVPGPCGVAISIVERFLAEQPEHPHAREAEEKLGELRRRQAELVEREFQSALRTAREEADRAAWSPALGALTRALGFCPGDEAALNLRGEMIGRAVPTVRERELLVLPGSVVALAMSPDGEILASGCQEPVIRLWDVSSGRLLRVLPGHPDSISWLGFSPDGRWLASGGWEGDAWLWDTSNWEIARRFPTPRSKVEAMAFSGDGRTFACPGLGWSIQVLDTRTWEGGRPLVGHEDSIHCMALTRDGRTLASGSEDKTLRLWNCSTGEQVVSHEFPYGVRAVAISADGDLVAAGSWEVAGLFEISTGRKRCDIPVEGAWVFCLAFAADGRTLVSGDSTGAIRLWEVPTGEPVASLGSESGEIRSLALARDRRTLAVGTSDGVVGIWQLRARRRVQELPGHNSNGVEIALSPDGRAFAVAGGPGSGRVVDFAGGRPLFRLEIPEFWAVAFSPDGGTVAAGCTDGRVRLVDASTGRAARQLPHGALVESVAFAPDGSILASGGRDGRVALWDVPTGRELAALSAHQDMVTTLAFSPDGTLLASAARDGGPIKLWDVAGKAQVAVFEVNSAGTWGLAFAPDGRTLASAEQDGKVCLRDVETGRTLRELVGHLDLARWVSFMPNGRFLASASWDGTVRIWSTDSSDCLAVLEPSRPYRLNAVVFSPDGRHLLAAGRGPLVVWSFPRGEGE